MTAMIYKWMVLWLQRKRIKKVESDDGFTLIELILVLVIIGILSAIAIPSFLNQANRARRAEAEANIGNIARSQQAYYIENGQFASTFEELQNATSSIDNPAGSESSNYTYAMNVSGDSVITVSTPNQDSFPVVAGRNFIQGVVPLFVLCNAPTGFTSEQMRSAMVTVDSPSDCPQETPQ